MLEELLSRWGYVAIVVGTYVEGEGVLLAAGALVHAKLLALPLVVLAATLGSIGWGQTWFNIGRIAGRGLIERRPDWQVQAARAEHWLSRWGLGLLLFGRFLVGMGTLLPALIGASGFSRLRFCILDSLGALIWAALVACAGFGLGAGLQRLTASAGWLQLLAAGVGGALGLVLLARMYVSRARRRA